MKNIIFLFYYLKKKEELIRTKLLLEQSQTNRQKDFDAMQRLQLRLQYFEVKISSK